MSEVTETNPNPAANNRFMLSVVIGLAVLIVIVLGVGGYGLWAGWGKHEAAPAAPKKPVSMTLAPGFRILSSDTQPGRLILHVRSDTIDEIDIIDLNDGRIVSQIHAEAAK